VVMVSVTAEVNGRQKSNSKLVMSVVAGRKEARRLRTSYACLCSREGWDETLFVRVRLIHVVRARQLRMPKHGTAHEMEGSLKMNRQGNIVNVRDCDIL